MLKIGRFTIEHPYILAPMAGVSQMPFRRLALKHGAGLAPTELVSAKGLFFESTRTKSYLTYDSAVEKPFVVQLFGGEEEPMAVAAEKAMAMGADIIDINMGCPVKKVTKINAGSALLCDQARASSIVRAMLKRTAYQIPITAKIRSGWDSQNLNYVEIGQSLQDAGISAIALHARTRAQGYSGRADWQHIAKLKSHLSIPVIGNGDVMNVQDAKKLFRETKCDAIMIGRAALGNPWIFRSILQNGDSQVSSDERLAVVQEHFTNHVDLHRKLAEENKIEFNEFMALTSFRSHLIWYSKGLKDGARFRQAIMSSENFDKTCDLIEDFFGQANIASEDHNISDEGIDYRQAFG